MANVKDMTKGSYVKNIILFAIPLFFSNLFQQLYNSIDAIIVGNKLEDEYNTLDKTVQKHLDDATAKADQLCEKKVAEIMEV